MLHFARKSAFAAAFAMALAAAWGRGAAVALADEFRARYAVSLIGFRIGEVAATGIVGTSTYRINVNAKLTGVAAMISDVKLVLTSSGSVQKDRLAPSSYATTSTNSQGVRTVRMSLDAGNVKSVEIFPPFEERPDRVPVNEAHKRNILDPTSALIMSVPDGEPLVGPAACDRTIRIYDGYVRFNIALHYVGLKEVAIEGYSGRVSVGAARYTPVAGHSRDSKSAKFMAENKDIEVWLAPIPRAHVVVPLHVRLMTMAGEAEIEASQFVVVPSGVRAAKTH